MQILCNRNELAEALSIVTRAASSKTTTPVLEGVLLEMQGDTLQLTCTDQSLTLRAQIHCPQEGDNCSLILPARLLAEVVRKLPDGQVKITVDERLQARIQCQGSRTTLQGIEGDKFPELPEARYDTRVFLPQKQLRDFIRETAFALSLDESRPLLTGFLLEVEEGQFRVVALDGMRLALRSCVAKSDSRLRVVAPGKPLIEVSRILNDDDSEIALDLSDNYLRIDIGNLCMILRLLEGNYIQYQKILPQDSQTRMRIERKLLEDAVDRAGLLARDSKSNLVKLSIAEDQLTLTSNGELGDVFEQIPIQLDGKPLEIAFNIKFITELLKSIAEETLFLQFTTNLTPCVCKPSEPLEDGSSYLYLLLPVRIHG